MLNLYRRKSKFNIILDTDINIFNDILNSDKQISPSKTKIYWKVQRRLSYENNLKKEEATPLHNTT
jgi:hypothetical protein